MSAVSRVCRALDERYGRKEWAGGSPVLDELIYTILSQNTTAANSRRAFERLRRRFPSWEAALRAPVDEIADAIKPGGLANIKAPRIRSVLERACERSGSPDLQWIAELSDGEALKVLAGFDGVGPKTAACVLMFGLGRPVMPVDTHVHRVVTRVGLIAPVSAEKAHVLLAEMVPPEEVFSLHVNLVEHGRKVCRARNPLCGGCVLREECAFFAGKA